MGRFIELQRDQGEENHTYGRLKFEGFECDTIEDEAREIKVPGETRIPAGIYPVALRAAGRLHEKALTDHRFMDIHRGVLWIQNVPGFEWIYMHWGATAQDSLGCIIIGKGRGQYNGLPAVFHSSTIYRELYIKLLAALEAGDKLFIVIKDAVEDAHV